MARDIDDIQKASQKATKLSRKELIRAGLDTKTQAIAGYDAIIWKVRSGYIAILYGALTLLLGRSGVDHVELTGIEAAKAGAILGLIAGFSLSAFLVDFSYVRKKLRVIVIRNRLIEIAIDAAAEPDEGKLKRLLHVAAETPLRTHFPLADEKYRSKLLWNFNWILLPIYATTPMLAAVFMMLVKPPHWPRLVSGSIILITLVVLVAWGQRMARKEGMSDIEAASALAPSESKLSLPLGGATFAEATEISAGSYIGDPDYMREAPNYFKIALKVDQTICVTFILSDAPLDRTISRVRFYDRDTSVLGEAHADGPKQKEFLKRKVSADGNYYFGLHGRVRGTLYFIAVSWPQGLTR